MCKISKPLFLLSQHRKFGNVRPGAGFCNLTYFKLPEEKKEENLYVNQLEMSSEEMEVPSKEYPSDNAALDFNSFLPGVSKIEVEEQSEMMETDVKEDSITLDVVSWGRSDFGAIFRLDEECMSTLCYTHSKCLMSFLM